MPRSDTTPTSPADSASSCFRPSGHKCRLRSRDLAVGYRVGRGEGRFRADRVVARGLDLALHAGELVCLLGPNGAGKSTLLRTLAGLQPPLGGGVEIDGRRYDEWRPRQLARRLAVVLTDRALPGMMTGEDLVRLGRHPHTPWTGSLSDADRAAIRQALESVDAVHLAPRPLAEMSDGERQKVTVARALAQEAETLVLDEVTAFLDLPRRVEILRLLRRLAHDEGKAIVLATHDLDLALRSADRLWLLSAGSADAADGAELHDGLPESLVLDGTFERVFAAEGVDFDRASGSFRLHRRHRGTVRVDGGGLAATWTRRALDRLGFELDEAAPLRVVVEEGSSETVWRVGRKGSEGGGEARHRSLDAALADCLGRSGSGP